MAGLSGSGVEVLLALRELVEDSPPVLMAAGRALGVGPGLVMGVEVWVER